MINFLKILCTLYTVTYMYIVRHKVSLHVCILHCTYTQLHNTCKCKCTFTYMYMYSFTLSLYLLGWMLDSNVS